MFRGKNFTRYIFIWMLTKLIFKSTVTREILPGVKFLILTWVGKNWFHTWVSTGPKGTFFYFISPRGENIFGKICGIFYKNVIRKKTFCMQLQGYIKTMMLDFINKRSKIFKFKTFKIVLLATINSKIVTASLLLNLYSCY